MITIPEILYYITGLILVVGCGVITKGKVMTGIIFYAPIGWFLHMLSGDIELQRIKEMLGGKLDPVLADAFPTRAEFWYQNGADSLVHVLVYATTLGLVTWAFFYLKNRNREPGDSDNPDNPPLKL